MPKTLAAEQILPHNFTEDGRIRAVIDAVLPAVDGGRFAVKRVAGESVRFTAHSFTDGHEVLRVMLRRRAEDQPAAREVPMRPLERCMEGRVRAARRRAHRYTVSTWVAGIVFTRALAFGLGGRNWAAERIERWWPGDKKNQRCNRRKASPLNGSAVLPSARFQFRSSSAAALFVAQ